MRLKYLIAILITLLRVAKTLQSKLSDALWSKPSATRLPAKRGRTCTAISTGLVSITLLAGSLIVRAQEVTLTLTITRVKQTDNVDDTRLGEFYAKVKIGGVAQPQTGHREDDGDVSPNWRFSRSAALNSTVPFQIDIWDHDSPDPDDHCDVSPVHGKKALEISYNLRTGQISGDVTGACGDLIHARGAGDSDRVEIWFRVTRAGSCQAPPPPVRTAEVWASDLKIKLDWATSINDEQLQKVERALRAFNNRLYDATDGQWRAGRFFIHDANTALGETDKGVGHFHERRSHTTPNHGHAGGRPNDPEHFHVTMGTRLDNTDESARTFAGTFLMEFLHSWTGLKDEYEKTSGGARTQCPLNPSRDFPNGCVMWKTNDPTINELCRPENHNPNTEQGNVRGMDCYSWLVKVMGESGHPGFVVPRVYIPGPTNAPTLRFVYLTIQRVRQIDSPGGDRSGDFYARVTMDGVRFSRSTYRANDADVSPNWCFGLAYSSNQARSIPIGIEILDVVSNASDRQCDVNPRSNKRQLSLTYNPTTGEITGDAAGSRDRAISMTGAGDADRVAIDFVVTSR